MVIVRAKILQIDEEIELRSPLEFRVPIEHIFHCGYNDFAQLFKPNQYIVDWLRENTFQSLWDRRYGLARLDMNGIYDRTKVGLPFVRFRDPKEAVLYRLTWNS